MEAAGVTRVEHQERKSSRKRNSRDLQRAPLQYSAMYWPVHACEENYPNLGKGLEETVPGAHTNLGTEPAPTGPDEKAS